MNQPQPTPLASSGTGLAPNLAGALSYVFPPLSGILFLVLEKQSPFVRFHGAQSTIFGVAWVVLWVGLTILSTVLSVVPILGWLVSALIMLACGLGGFILWLVLMWRAYNGSEWELPVIGPQARRLLASPSVS